MAGAKDWESRPAPDKSPFDVGDRILLTHMPGEVGPGRPRPGEEGTVTHRNRVGSGPGSFWQFSVDWDNGSSLMLSIPPDSAKKIQPQAQGMRTVILGDLLPPGVTGQLAPIMNGIQEGRFDVVEGRRRILEVLEPHREELLAKEVLPEYLSWYLASNATAGGDVGDIGLN